MEYSITTLPNGLTVVLSEDHSTPIVHADLWYHVGSVDEQKGHTGLAHFLEHMMFKGTHELSKGQIDAMIVAEFACRYTTPAYFMACCYSPGRSRDHIPKRGPVGRVFDGGDVEQGTPRVRDHPVVDRHRVA